MQLGDVGTVLGTRGYLVAASEAGGPNPAACIGGLKPDDELLECPERDSHALRELIRGKRLGRHE